MSKIYAIILAGLLTAVLSVSAPASSFAQAENKNPQDYFNVYSTNYAQQIVNYLAQDKLMGREAGTKEGEKAMKFVYKEFKKAGYSPVMQPITEQTLKAAIGEPKKGKAYPQKMCNVIARIDGSNSNKYIIIGAHYDHLGYKEGIGIHHGADDNASGIVALLSLAKMMKAAEVVPEYTILFCAWDGEEKGLLGSKYFVSVWPDKNLIPADAGPLKESAVLYMNFDMVGRTVTPEKPGVTFAWNNCYPYLLDICKKAQDAVPAPFQVLLDERTGNGKGGSDYAPFSAHNVPFIAWMEDFMHEDYHKPTDTPDKLHWEKLRKTTLLAYMILWELAM